MCSVAHFMLMTAGAVAEKTGINWATVTLAPGVIPSRYTMPAGSYIQPFRGTIGEKSNQSYLANGVDCRAVS